MQALNTFVHFFAHPRRNEPYPGNRKVKDPRLQDIWSLQANGGLVTLFAI